MQNLNLWILCNQIWFANKRDIISLLQKVTIWAAKIGVVNSRFCQLMFVILLLAQSARDIRQLIFDY